MPSSENFSHDELKCKHCGENEMAEEMLIWLEHLRKEIGNRPINLNSAYRCPDHNDAISMSGRNGPHTTGLAVDIRVRSQEYAMELIKAAVRLGARGIGVKMKGAWSGRFIHLDLTSRKAIWSY